MVLIEKLSTTCGPDSGLAAFLMATVLQLWAQAWRIELVFTNEY